MAPLLLLLVMLPTAIAQICAGQQNFPQEQDSAGWVQDLQPGVPANDTLCAQHWIWYKLPTRYFMPYTQLGRSGTNWTLEERGEQQLAAISVMLDAGYDEVNSRFTTLSFVAVNGTPPSDILRADPYDPAAYAGTQHFFAEYTDRETLTFGFNDTLGGACHSPLAEHLYFGIRCVHPLGQNPGPCGYNLTVTALPHYLRNGMRFDGYLRPSEAGADEAVRHYFRVELSNYEKLQIDVARSGDGRPLHDAHGLPLGLGLAGGAYVQRLDEASCPANGSSSLLQMCEIGLNDTAPCTLGSACSARDAPTTDLVLMIEASVGARPVTYIDQTNSPYEEGCLPETLCAYVPNLVDRFGQRPLLSAIPGAEDRMPRYNVPSLYIPISTEWHLQLNNKNELRADRGVYTLSVTQLRYEEGALVPGERRPGCVGYGQWRYFRLLTSGVRDASLFVHAVASSGRGLGGVYLRQHARPHALDYDAMTQRGTPLSAPQRVTASPCALNTSTMWHIGLMLEDEATAVSRGVPETDFLLSVSLEDALLDMRTGRVAPRGGDARAPNPARGATGDGFVCCGVFKYFLVPNVPPRLSLRASLEMVAGNARAVFLKARSCPTFEADVADDTCLGQCTVSWLTRFDAYDGNPTTASSAAPLVPNGLGDGCPARCPADLRHGGDWYVGVQALPGTEAEFSLDISVVEPPHIDYGHQCDPSEPECRAPVQSDALDSAAPRSASRGGACGRAAAAVLSAAACFAVALSMRENVGR